MERHHCTVDEGGYCDECGATFGEMVELKPSTAYSALMWENLIRTKRARQESRRRNK